MIEANGFLGVTDEIIKRLSQGTTAVSHFRNVKPWMTSAGTRTGRLNCGSSRSSPYRRYGRDPDGLVDDMRAVGFDLTEDEDSDFDLPTEAAFALAERITGIRLSRQLFSTAEFVGG